MSQHLTPHRLHARPACGPLSTAPTRLNQALHAALIGLAVAFAAAGPSAQAAEASALDNPAPRLYRIDAGPLGRALSAAAVNAGIALSFEPALTDGLSGPALAGSFTVREAFARLLAGTGLEIVGRSDGSYTVRKLAAGSNTNALPATGAVAAGESVLPTVRVKAAREDGGAGTAYRAKAANAGVLGNKALKDTPYSIEVYTRELLDNKQARSLADMTKADASVGLMIDNLVAENESLSIRGLGIDTYTGQKLDGLNVRSRARDLPLEHLERVEILKGASGFLYGFGSPGGTVNYVLKRPTDETVRRLSTQIMDSGLTLIHGDLGGRFGANDAFGYRVNLVNEEGDTYINDGKSRRHSDSLALDWRITPDLVWRADALLSEHTRKGGYWALVPNADGAVNNWAAGVPLAPIDGSKRLAPSFTRYGSRQETYGTDLTWQFAPDWKLSLAYRMSESGRDLGQPAIYADADGNYSLSLWNGATRFQSRHTQGMIQGKLKTGPLTHDLTLGASHNTTRSSVINNPTIHLDKFGNLANPANLTNPFTSFASHNDAGDEFDFMRRREVFASDTLHLGSDWDLIVGLRHSSLESRDSNYDKSKVTPTLAVVFRPIQELSLYGSYVEALEEGATAPETAANANQVFPPLVSKQHEVGAKAEGRGWSATAALFRLQRGLTYTTPDNVFTQDGEARYEGLELSGKFRLSPHWLVMASAMWLDATNQKTSGGTLDGKRISGVAREQASVYSEYRVAGLPLTLTGGVRHVGKRPLDGDNQWQVGSVTLLDAGARYETQWGSKPVTLRLNVDNLADKAYWVTHNGWWGLSQGAPRTIKLGAQIDF